MRQVPNIFTLLNLFCGCIAIVFIFQNELTYVTNGEDGLVFFLPEKMFMASAFIGLAAVIDFLDGLVARLLNRASEMGKQLDSIADVVSFGVAPGLIVYQFLRLSFAQHENGLDVSWLWLLPAFLIPCAGAYRLARFNLDTSQAYGFKGVPIPAAGLLVASFPLIYGHTTNARLLTVLTSEWFWYVVIAALAYLMVSRLPMMALKFKDFDPKRDLMKLVLVIIAIVAAVLLKWLSVPVIFVAYVLLSLLRPSSS